ncbi:MAG TPA: glycine cleavage T C-terminal barrel domain-containing protein [Fimbriimonadaceae bacterium]|nr:glycine cleavage T C-terminal barrel domain-containing protein [Fimbriimonadaceae bacterium]
MAEAPPAASDRLTQDYDLLRDSSAIVELPPLAIIELAGEDRKGWLQGQATNDVRQLDLGASTRFCFCEPTGQILAICEIWSLKDRFIVTCPRARAEAVLQRVETMVVMEDVVARDLTGEFALISVQGPQATRALAEHLILPLLDAAETEFEKSSVLTLRSDRTGSGGWDLLIPAEARKAQTAIRKPFETVSLEAYMVARLEAGVPLLDKDYTAKTMPPELGMAFEASHVDYRKGCYTGQEVLMRIHSRGHTNRTWMGLRAEEPLTEGAAVTHMGAEVGHVTSAGFSPDFGYIGAAILRNQAAAERETVDAGGVTAEVRRMPLLRYE